jgi:membrane-bound ClpP family serine protease
MFWVWAILLLVLGLGLAILEVFFPSAGILGFLSAASILAAIIVGFQDGPLVGFLILGVAVIGLPTIVVLAFKYWPNTAIGRRILLGVPSSEDVLPDGHRRSGLKELVGRVGRAKCKMLPGGAITIGGRTIDAVSEGIAIDVGQSVRVIAVRGNRVVVRPVEDEVPTVDAENPLERPIDSVVPDPFDEQPPA